MEDRRFSDVGGTPGGLGHFVMGFIMTCAGAYFLADRVTVVGSYWSFYGGSSFGITLIPLLIWRGTIILERPQHPRMAADLRGSDFHFCRRDCQHAHLLPADQPDPHNHHAGAAGRRPGTHRPLDAFNPRRASGVIRWDRPSLFVVCHHSTEHETLTDDTSRSSVLPLGRACPAPAKLHTSIGVRLSRDSARVQTCPRLPEF